jgi:hypothetical protein
VLTETRSIDRSATTKAHRRQWRAYSPTRTFRSQSSKCCVISATTSSLLRNGKAGQAITDKAILELAAADQRAIVTLNRKHFVRLHKADPSHAGIIVCSLDLDFDGQAARVHEALAASESMTGHLIRVNRPQR